MSSRDGTRLSKTRHAIQYSSWAHLGGYRYAKVSLERKGKLKIIGRETALIYFGRFCQVQNDGRKSLSLQIVMGHGKCVGERKLTSMQLKISFLVRVKMESFRWWAGRVKSPRARPGAEEKASGAKGRRLDPSRRKTRSSKAVGRCRSG